MNPSDASSDSSPTASRPSSGTGRAWRKLVAVVLAVAVVGTIFVAYRDTFTLANLARHESTLRTYQDAWFVILVAFALYVGVTAVSLPGAVPLTLTYGWYFGFYTTVVIVSFASTAGATLAFLSSRYLFRDAMYRRFGERYSAVDRALEKEGAFYLFTLRLVPLVPFFVINLVMGLTPIRTWTFWWVSQLGMLPGTAVYTYAGAAVPSLSELAERGAAGIFTLEIGLAFGMLGIFPIAVKKGMAFVKARRRIGEADM